MSETNPNQKNREGRPSNSTKPVRQPEIDISALSRAEVERLANDLKIHQLELEAQNEELRRTQAELKASQDRYLNLYEFAPVAYLTLETKSNQILEINLAGSRLLDVDRSALLKTPFTRYIDPDFADTFYLCRKKALAKATTETCELKMEKNDNTPFWAKVEIAASANSQIRMTMVDITERKKIEDSLREARDYLENLFNYANAPIMVWGPDLKITRFNQAFERLTGRSASKMLGEKIDALIPADQRKEALQKINHTLVKGERWEVVEIPIQHQDGSLRTVLWNSAVIFDADGKSPVATIAQGQEITELKNAEKILSQQTLELEDVNRELESFSYSVSHDLRAPLRTMDGFCRAILEEYADKLDAKGKDYLQRVIVASQTMAQLIEALLTLSRVGRAEIYMDKVDLSDISHSITRELSEAQPERQAEFVISSGMIVKGDLQLLRSLLRNLLENAWKFTSTCPLTRIEVGLIAQPGEKIYYIKDNGVGFNMQYAAKLFQPFQRLHSNKEFPGTGIGLATVQRIVHRHGGRVWAEGAVGKGATFYFTLT